MTESTKAPLQALAALVGEWTTEATHPLVPGTIVRGTTSIAWLEGDRFLIVRAKTDHPDFPDAISIIGDTSRDRVEPGANPPQAASLTMYYFDERGVHRVLNVEVTDEAWKIVRIAPGFSQRFLGRFADGGNTIDGLWQLCEDDKTWKDDLKIIYRRRTAR